MTLATIQIRTQPGTFMLAPQIHRAATARSQQLFSTPPGDVNRTRPTGF
jgi:hypothetical protein